MQTCCAIHPQEAPGRTAYPAFMEVVRRVAAGEETVLIDHHRQWEPVRVSDPARFDTWMANPFHPNALGHWVFAERILADLELGPLKHCAAPAGPAATGKS